MDISLQQSRSFSAVSLLDIFTLLICMMSYVALMLLCLNHFYASLAIIGGVLSSGICLLLFRLTAITWPKPTTIIMIGGLLAITLLLRMSPFLYLVAGEDQGTYINTAAYYQHHHSVIVTDTLRQSIHDPATMHYYDRYNQSPKSVSPKGIVHLQGKHGPGLNFYNLSDHQYVFQFYPLHPLWLAISGTLLGDRYSVASLLLFASLAVLFFSLLAYELSRKNLFCAAGAGLLLATNALEVFFSKFPTAEIPEQAFLIGSLYYLVKYYRLGNATRQHKSTFYLLLSALLLGCCFFIHIDVVILMPWYACFLFIALYIMPPSEHRRYLIGYLMGIFFLFVLSIIYGLIWSPTYILAVYQNIVVALLPSFLASMGKKKLLIAMTLVAAIGMMLFHWLYCYTNCRQWILYLQYWLPRLNNILTACIFVILLLSGFRVAQMSIKSLTAHLLSNSSLVNQYHDMLFQVIGHGLHSLPFSAFILVIFYISPLAFILFIYALLRYPFPNQPAILRFGLLLFIAIAWCYIGIGNFIVPYQFFYLRFILPFLVPATLLLVALKLGEMISVHKTPFITTIHLLESSHVK